MISFRFLVTLKIIQQEICPVYTIQYTKYQLEVVEPCYILQKRASTEKEIKNNLRIIR
jgi:hypothetical protein